MIVCSFLFDAKSQLICVQGELLEKSTRVLTPEEQALLDTDWVGRNGTKRKMEVCS